jgi:amino acid transporter/nucleotide-binding universal stress UspA family protein
VTDSRQIRGELARDLRLFHVLMMGLGMMIGAGVFVGIGLSMQSVGTGGMLLTFALSGLVALFTAMSFAELSSAIPRAGGAYNFARIGFGRGASFIAGWMEWFASSLAGAFYAIIFATFTLEYVNELLALGLAEGHKLILTKVLALLAAGFFIHVNYRGSSETGKVGAIFTAGQMLFVLAIAVVGIASAAVQPQRLANFRPFMLDRGWWRLLGTMGVIYVAFEGFEVIAQSGDETIEPKRNIPKAMLYAVLIVTVTYVGVAFATVVAIHPDSPQLGALTPAQWVGQFTEIGGFRESIKRLMPYGGLIVTLAVVFSSTSALNATIYSATRASYALGRDRMLPAAVAAISSTRKTPYVALLATAAIVLVAAALLNPRDGAATASIMFLFLFFLVNLCVIRIRLNMGDELEYGYVMPLFPLFPLLAIIFQAAMAGGIVYESSVAWIVGPAWVGAGAVVYLAYSRSRAVTTADEITVFHEEPPEPGRQRVMVSVANPDNALEMIRITYRLCEAMENPQVELLHMVPVPHQVPLSDAEKYMLDGKEGMLETMLYLAPLFPIHTHLRYCRSVARGIVSAIREKKTELLIMGWHGRHGARVFRLGSTVDPVIERAPCRVVVLKGCGGNRPFRRVLVPLAGGPNGAFALEVASVLADPQEGRLTAFSVRSGRKPFDLDAFVAQNRHRLRADADRVQTKTVDSRDVVGAILAELDEYDLIVLGCTHDPLLRQVTRSSIPDTVAKMCDKPLVMVKASGGIRSWLRRWI